MRLEFHKILSEGRSVRYDRDDPDVIHLNVIVTQEDVRRNRARRSA
jgi:hypothetical protein